MGIHNQKNFEQPVELYDARFGAQLLQGPMQELTLEMDHATFECNPLNGRIVISKCCIRIHTGKSYQLPSYQMLSN